MTGLTRKEVRRLRDKISTGDSSIATKTTPFEQVLHHWHKETEFTDTDGLPKELHFAGDEQSFTALVKRFGGDIPPGAMRTEMKRVGVVREDTTGRLSVVTRAYKAESDHETLVSILVHGVYTLLSNVEHNTNPDRTEGTWANRVAHTTALRESDTRQLRRITKDRIVDFAESIDDIFMAYESLQEDGAGQGSRDAVAVGIYYFEERDKNADYEW
jgi:hypothetical protein